MRSAYLLLRLLRTPAKEVRKLVKLLRQPADPGSFFGEYERARFLRYN